MKHLLKCCYYTDYNEFILLLSREEVGEVRRAIYKEICKLAWIPAAISDRLWDYRKDSRWIAIPYEDLGGPRIWINPGNARSPILDGPVDD
jgi:hypothetical protein